MSEKLQFSGAPPYEPHLFIGHSSPHKRASIDCPAGGHQYLPDLWKQPKTGVAAHLQPPNRPRSYSQGRAVQHSVNLADLKSQQHPPFRELPQLPKFKGSKPVVVAATIADKTPAVADMTAAIADEMIAPTTTTTKVQCYHSRLDHTTMMITPQYSTSTDEGIETDLEDSAAASFSPTQLTHQSRLAYQSLPPPPTAVIKSHSQNLADQLSPCVVNQLQYHESDHLVSSLPSCAANEIMKYADCSAVSMAATANSCSNTPPPPQPPPSWDRRAAFLAHNQSDGGRPRLQEHCMSPVCFREGRRASDGLMNQIDSVSAQPPLSPRMVPQQYCNSNGRGAQAFNAQKLQQQECGGGKVKGGGGGWTDFHSVQKEHETLKMLYQSCLPSEEQVRKQTGQQITQSAAEPNARNCGGEYRCKDVPPRSPSAAMAKRFNYTTDGYALDKAGLQQQLLQQRLLQHKRTILQKQGAAFSQCSTAAANVLDSPTKRQHHAAAHRGQPLYNKTAQPSPQHSDDGHAHQSDGSWQSLPHTMATCQINDFDSQANWLSVPDPQHHWYCTSGPQYSFSKNYSQVRAGANWRVFGKIGGA